MLTLEELVADLEALGLERGDYVLVHSSLSKLGFVEGGAETVIDAILAAVGEEGLVAVPTLTGSRELGPDNPPVFDPDNTPSWTGIIPETFRKRPDAVRSLHPTHSVAAIGRKAVELVSDHELADFPCGPGTPYYKLGSWGGKILLLGVDLKVNTTYHGLEEEWGAPGHIQRLPVEAKIRAGGAWRTVETYIHQYGIARDYPKTLPFLKEAGILVEGTVGKADSFLIETGPMIRIVGEKLARDPRYLYQS
jgi:aminoglycoside 3-N-acetyltransferase